MTSDPRPISIETSEDRYSRLRLIPWWDQEVLRRSKVLVVGAGALGNEIIKNLALLGIGAILIVDFDSIETSNLSRSILYTTSDNGRFKAHTAAAAAKEINPDCSVSAINADVISGVGLGVFRWADVVICGLDNREARLAVNAACWKVNRPWVDGATEAFQGVARVFQPPDGVCYECTLGERELQMIAARNSCGIISKEASRQGGTPTTPATAAVIAGIEVQEAIKLLHPDAGLPNLVGRGFFFDGISYDCFTINYVRKDDCLSHETYENIIETDLESKSATLRDIIKIAQKHLGGEITLEMPSEMITGLRCNGCGRAEEFFRLLRTVDADDAKCPHCGAVRVPDVLTECGPGSAFASISLTDLGFPMMDIILARSAEGEIGVEISGDFHE